MVDDRHSASGNGESHKLLERQTTNSSSSSLLMSELSASVKKSDLAQPEWSLSSEQQQYVRVKQEENNRTSHYAGQHQQLDDGSMSSSSNSTGKLNQQPLNANNIPFLASRKSFKAPLISQEKFHWDQSEQGHILGAFFYGYILFQIPGARMAESMGAKWIIMAASAGSAVISLAFPLSTQLNSIHLLMVLRFVMGLCQSAFFPAAYVIFCRWLPEKERSVLLPIMFIGSNMGSISTYILSSYLISSSYGWPSVFYLSGLVCSLCSLLWFIFGSNGPEDNWFITDKEILFIELNVNNQSSESNSIHDDEDDQQFTKKAADNNNNNIKRADCCNGVDLNNNNNTMTKISLPADDGCLKVVPVTTTTTKARTNITPNPSWPKLLKSAPVWIFILSMYGNEWSNVVICFELPTYLNSALNFPIEQNGVINSFFQLSYAVASPIMSSLGAYFLDKHLFGMRKIHVRKLFQSLATFGQLACFVSVPICGANRGLIIMFMFLAIVFKSCANAGDIMVSGDLSPEYAGTIFAFANSIGNTAGVLVPASAGWLVNDAYQREQWTPFWLITASIMCFSGLIFLVFGETRRQDFSLDNEEDEQKQKQRRANNSEQKQQQQQHIELMECERKLSAANATTTVAFQRCKEKQQQQSYNKLKPLAS